MAIKLDYTYRGVTIKDAYVRFGRIMGGKHEELPRPDKNITGFWFASAGVYASADEKQPVTVIDVRADYQDGVSPYPTLYAALKAMPGFETAGDC